MLRLADSVLARRGVEYQQHLVRRLGNLFADGSLNLRQLLHQVLLRLQAPGRVDDADVDLLRQRRFYGLVSDTRGVTSLLDLDDPRPEAIGPDAELLYRSGAEGVARPQEDGFPFR